MNKLLILAILLLFSATVYAADWELDKGSIEIGGSIRLEALSGELYANNESIATFVMFSPTAQYFIQPRFSLGGKLEYSNYGAGDYSTSSSAIGPALTYYFGDMDSKYWRFVGANYIVGSEKYKYDDYRYNYFESKSESTSFQLMGGMIFKLDDHFVLKGNLYYHIDTYDRERSPVGKEYGNVVGLAFGFSGFVY